MGQYERTAVLGTGLVFCSVNKGPVLGANCIRLDLRNADLGTICYQSLQYAAKDDDLRCEFRAC